MSRDFSLSTPGNLGTDRCLETTPRHSTPKYKNSVEKYTLNDDDQPKSEVEIQLRQLLAQRENELSTVLRAYENVLVAWQQDRKGNNPGTTLANDKPFENLNLQNIDRTSVVSESSKDSGRLTESPHNPLEGLTDSLSVLELIKELAQQLQINEHELESHKSYNLTMSNQVRNLTNEVEELRRINKELEMSNHNAEYGTLRSTILTLEKELKRSQEAEKKLTEDLNVWRELYNESRLEIENLKGEILASEKEHSKAVKSKRELKQKIQNLQEKQFTMEAQDEKRTSTLIEHQHALKKMNLALSTLKMIFDQQVDIVQMCMKSVTRQNGVGKSNLETGPSTASHSSQEMEQLLQSLLRSAKVYKDSSDSELSDSNRIAKGKHKHFEQKKNKTNSCVAVNDNATQKSTVPPSNRLETSAYSVLSDESLKTLNRMLTTSREMLSMMP